MTIKERIAEIWAQIAAHEIEIKKLNLDIEKLLRDIEMVQLDCTHSNKIEQVLGDTREHWRECADCGAEIR